MESPDHNAINTEIVQNVYSIIGYELCPVHEAM